MDMYEFFGRERQGGSLLEDVNLKMARRLLDYLVA
jgi:hypothetical protein